MWRGCVLVCAVVIAPLQGNAAAGTDRAADDFAMGMWFYAQKKYDIAEQEFRDFLSKYPGHAKQYEARLMLARTLAKLGKTTEGITVLTGLQKEKQAASLLPEILFELGLAYEKQGEHSEALRCFERFCKRYREHHLFPWAQDRRGVCLMRLKRYHEAREVLAPAVERFLTGPEAVKNTAGWETRLQKIDPALKRTFQELCQRLWVNSAIAALNDGDPQSSYSAFAAFLKRFPTSSLTAVARFGLAQSLVESKRLEEAASVYHKLALAGGPRAPEAAFERAMCLYQLKRYGEAAESFSRCAKKYAASPYAQKASRYAGMCLYQAKRYEDALLALTAHIRSNRNDSEALYWLGMAHLKRKQPVPATVAFEKILKDDPTGPRARDALLTLAEVYQQQGREDEAVAAFRSFAARHPGTAQAIRALYSAGVILYRQGKNAEAEALIQKCLQQKPKGSLRAQVLFLAGELAYLRKDYKKAEALYVQLLRSDPEAPDGPAASLRLAWIAYHQGQYEVAGTYAEKAVRSGKEPALTAARYLLGLTCYERSKWKEALGVLETYVSTSKELPYREEAFFYAACAAQRLGEVDRAQRLFTMLLAEYPHTSLKANVLYERAELLRGAGRLGEAEACCRSFLKEFKDHSLAPHVLYCMGLLAYQRKEFAEAAQTFHSIAEKYPDSALRPQALYQAGLSWEKAGEIPRALEEFEAVLGLSPESSLAQKAALAGGICLEKLRRYKEAETYLRKVVEECDDTELFPQAVYELASCLSEQGKDTEAEKLYGRLLADFPESSYAPQAGFFLGEFSFQRKAYKEAVQYFRKALRGGLSEKLKEEALYRCALATLLAGEHAKAVSLFDSFLRACPKSSYAAEALFQAGEALLALGKAAEALKRFDALQDPAYAAFGDRHAVAFRRGEAYLLLEDYNSAEKAFLQLAHTAPDWEGAPEVECNLGRALYHQHRLSEARRHFEKVLDMTTTETAAQAQFYLGECHLAEGKAKEALRAYFRVVTLWGAYTRWAAAAHYEIAVIYEAQGKTQEAKEALEKVIQVDPASKWAEAAKKKLASYSG